MRIFECWGCSLALAVLGISGAAAQQKNLVPKEMSSSKTDVTPPAKSPIRAAQESPSTKLPVRHVVLYKTGVGYFEHSGSIQGNQTIRVDFTSGQLNDVLQSLTILDLSGGRIAGVNYNSEAPLAQRLGMLRLPLEEKTDVGKFYGALRGARLQLRSGPIVITGRLLSVER